MKNKLMAAAAVLAVMSASSVALADNATDVKALKAQAAALKKQNAALEKRLNKIEQKQQQTAQARPAAQPASTDFMGMVTKGPLEVPDGPICWQGICIFGTLDAGLGYATHGAPNSGGFYTGDTLMQKFYNHANFGVMPSGLSQTSLGIKGEHEFMPGWSGVFYANTGINPQSGQLANAPGAQVANNGVPLGGQSMNIDGTRGGQPFNDQLYAGISSRDFGELTFGRHKTFSNDLISVYDPAGGAYDYSVIGFSGGPVAGLGYTDLGRIDDTLKYRIEYGPVHFGAMYKFVDGTAGVVSGYNTATTKAAATGIPCGASTVTGGTNYCATTSSTGLASHNDGYQFDLGGKYGGLEMDGVVSHFNQALTYGTFNPGTLTTNGVVQGTSGLNGLIGTPADVTSVMAAAKYTWNQFKFYAGYSHDNLQDPHDPLGVGANTGQGDYTALIVNNNGFNEKTKILQTEWAGVKYAWDPKTDLTVAYYHEGQNTYDTNAKIAANACNIGVQHIQTKLDSSCSGTLNGVSSYIDYHFDKHFDVYGGFMYSVVNGGMANGYLYYNNFAPTAGARFTF